MNGQPLCYWAITAALKSQCFESIHISTECQKIKDTVISLFDQKVCITHRPLDLAQDDSSTEDVLLDFSNKEDFDVLCTLQVTSPLTQPQDIIDAVDQFKAQSLDSLFTGCQFQRFLWNQQNQAINYDPLKRPRRQDFSGHIIENGAFYLTRKNILLNNKNRLGGKMGHHIMHPSAMIEIDEPHDWLAVESILQYNQRNIFSPALNKIKALVLDVDGTLTDGSMYYCDDGEQLKRFNTKDAYGISLLRQLGLKICVITGEDSPSAHRRMEKLQIENYFYGVKDKLPVLKNWAQKEKLTLREIAFAGDDFGDLQCMKAVGLSFCPSDAVSDIKQISNIVSSRKGGQAAVRELCDLLIKTQSLHQESFL